MKSLLGPEVGYTDLLDYEITEVIKNRAKEPRKSNPLRPSAAGYCTRRLAYDYAAFRGLATYETGLQNPATYRLLELGHSVEYAALRTFNLLKIVDQRYKQQVLNFFEIEHIDDKTEKEIVEGSCDVVFWSKSFKAIADVKSKKDKFSYSHKSQWDEDIEAFSHMPELHQLSDTAFYADDLPAFIKTLGDDWLTDNLYQLNLYACSDFMVSRGVDHAFIYRYNKNDSRHLEIRFRPSREMFDRVRQKYNLAARAVDDGDPRLAPRDFQLGSMRCAFCPYKEYCWEDADPLKSWYRTLPSKRWPKCLPADQDVQFLELEEARKSLDIVDNLEAQCAKIMLDLQFDVVRLSNGHIYELKYLKSPRPHYEVRRSKLK
jgi:hypothetical protein